MTEPTTLNFLKMPAYIKHVCKKLSEHKAVDSVTIESDECFCSLDFSIKGCSFPISMYVLPIPPISVRPYFFSDDYSVVITFQTTPKLLKWKPQK